MSALHTKSFPKGGKTITEFAPIRNGRVKPQIMDTINDEDGSPLYYHCDDDKFYTIKGYHDNFDVKANVKMSSKKNDKGSNPNRKTAALQ